MAVVGRGLMSSDCSVRYTIRVLVPQSIRAIGPAQNNNTVLKGNQSIHGQSWKSAEKKAAAVFSILQIEYVVCQYHNHGFLVNCQSTKEGNCSIFEICLHMLIYATPMVYNLNLAFHILAHTLFLPFCLSRRFEISGYLTA